MVQVATMTRSTSRGGQAGSGQRLAAGGRGHVDDGLVRVGEAPLGDADPAPDPLVVGVDAARDRSSLVTTLDGW